MTRTTDPGKQMIVRGGIGFDERVMRFVRMSLAPRQIRIPINESAGEEGQVQEYLEACWGEDIQHIALASTDI